MAYDIISADAHILEPTDIWETWLPQKYADKAPKLVKDVDGGDAWLFAGASEPDPIGLVSTPGMAWDNFRWTGVTYEEARAGCYDGDERLKDMDLDGVDAEVLFAPQRTAPRDGQPGVPAETRGRRRARVEAQRHHVIGREHQIDGKADLHSDEGTDQRHQ